MGTNHKFCNFVNLLQKIPRIPGKDEDDEDFFPQIQKDGEVRGLSQKFCTTKP